jgi:hypothetical protein
VGVDGPSERAELVEFAAGESFGVVATVEVVVAEVGPLDAVVEDVPAADQDAVADGFAGPAFATPCGEAPVLGGQSRNASRSSVKVGNSATCLATPPWPSGTRTHAATMSLCTSSPAERSTITSNSSSSLPTAVTSSSSRHGSRQRWEDPSDEI